MGVKLTGTLEVCDGCTISKSKSRAVRKKTHTRAKNPEESILVDTTGPFLKILICNHYWIEMVDYYSRYHWRFFTETKSQLPKEMEEFFEKLSHAVLHLSTYIMIIPGNTNQKCRRCVEKMLEYTTPYKPQFNGVIEIIFVFIKEGALAVFLNEKLNYIAQKILWEEVVHRGELVHNITATTSITKILFEIFYGENPRSLVRSQSPDVLRTSQRGKY